MTDSLRAAVERLRDEAKRRESDHRVRFANADMVYDYGYVCGLQDFREQAIEPLLAQHPPETAPTCVHCERQHDSGVNVCDECYYGGLAPTNENTIFARSGWQPIATAPKDRAVLLLMVDRYGRDYWCAGKWFQGADGSHGWVGSSFHCSDGVSWAVCDDPTYWQPLTPKPAAPSSRGDASRAGTAPTPPVRVQEARTGTRLESLFDQLVARWRAREGYRENEIWELWEVARHLEQPEKFPLPEWATEPAKPAPASRGDASRAGTAPTPPCPSCVSEIGHADASCPYCGGTGICPSAAPASRGDASRAGTCATCKFVRFVKFGQQDGSWCSNPAVHISLDDKPDAFGCNQWAGADAPKE